MWFIPTKKEIKKELKKIKQSFKIRDNKIKDNSVNVNKLKIQSENNKIKIARLEGALSVLLKKSQSQSQSSLKKSQSNFETKIINKIRKSKKSLVMAEISKLKGSLSIIDMFNEIVLEKGLCSKATFYRYISSLKKSNEIKLRQN